jgi:hypothetical protein
MRKIKILSLFFVFGIVIISKAYASDEMPERFQPSGISSEKAIRDYFYKIVGAVKE